MGKSSHNEESVCEGCQPCTIHTGEPLREDNIYSYVILFVTWLFYYILCSVLLYSVLFCSVLLCSVLFCSVLFYSHSNKLLCQVTEHIFDRIRICFSSVDYLRSFAIVDHRCNLKLKLLSHGHNLHTWANLHTCKLCTRVQKYFLLCIHMVLWKQVYFCQKLEIAV